MDNLTHTLTGLMLSRAGLNRLNPYSTAILMLAANAPDVDALSLFDSPATYLHHHRGITHAILFLPVMAALPVLLVRLFARKRFHLRSAYLLSVVGVASHLAIDYTNHYGIRLWLPVSADWLNLGITGVIDIWIWAVLLLAVAAPLLSQMVSSEIGAKGSSGRGFAVCALAFFLFYDCGRFVLHQRAITIQEARLYDGSPPQRVAAIPDFFSPFLWTGLVETESSFVANRINLLLEFDPEDGTVFYKAAQHPAVLAASREQPFRDLLKFSPFHLWRVGPAAELEDGIHVELMDLRFGLPPQPGFVAHGILTPDLQAERTWFSF